MRCEVRVFRPYQGRCSMTQACKPPQDLCRAGCTGPRFCLVGRRGNDSRHAISMPPVIASATFASHMTNAMVTGTQLPAYTFRRACHRPATGREQKPLTSALLA